MSINKKATVNINLEKIYILKERRNFLILTTITISLILAVLICFFFVFPIMDPAFAVWYLWIGFIYYLIVGGIYLLIFWLGYKKGTIERLTTHPQRSSLAVKTPKFLMVFDTHYLIGGVIGMGIVFAVCIGIVTLRSLGLM